MVLWRERGKAPPAPSIQNESVTMDKKTALISQVFMTFMMALLMSGIMSLIMLGPTAAWPGIWMTQFILAWPIAFVLTLVTWPASMMLSRLVLRRHGKSDRA
jgi:membrane protein implicated in regulation of membrane protease activity